MCVHKNKVKISIKFSFCFKIRLNYLKKQGYTLKYTGG